MQLIFHQVLLLIYMGSLLIAQREVSPKLNSNLRNC